MQIRTLFFVCMAAIVALGASLAGGLLIRMVSQARLANRVEHVVDIDTQLFVASDKIARERPATGNALLNETVPDAAARAEIAAARAETDAALALIERRIAARPSSGTVAQLSIIRDIARDLAALRAAADAALALPRRQRAPDIFATYLTRANAMFDMMTSALDVGDMEAALHDGTTVELIALSRHAWGLRATMTLRTAPLMAAIDAGAPLGADATAAQARVEGILRQSWELIRPLNTRLAGVPGIAASVARAEEALGSYERLCLDVIRAGREAGGYPITALEFGRVATRTAPALLQLRDDALSAARARVAESRRRAESYVVVATIVLVLTMVVTAVVLVLLERRIVAPVLALTDAIARIARLELDVAIPGRERRDEIGRMAVALEALRHDARDSEARKARIVHMARHDALTGLPNRIVLRERLDHAVAMARRGQISAALCLDLDGFKAVNDTFGHATGDLLLQGVAERLRASVREVDTVSRLGGDEFVVLLLDVDRGERAAMVARRILSAVSAPFDFAGQRVGVGCSIGIAVTPQHAKDGVTLMKYADLALYRAKAEGKGCWRFFAPGLEAPVAASGGQEPSPAIADRARVGDPL